MDHYVSGTSVILNSTTFARFDAPTDATPSNQAELDDLAEQIAIDYYTSIGVQANGRIEFGGIKKFIPGPYISEVTWRDWGDGFRTEIARWPSPVGLAKPPKIFSGGSAPIVGFEIVSAENCGTCTATATVALNFGTTPDLDSYDQFTVYGYGGCELNEPVDSLVGRFGIAAYGTRVGNGACPGLPTTGWWIISLCGLEDSCV